MTALQEEADHVRRGSTRRAAVLRIRLVAAPVARVAQLAVYDGGQDLDPDSTHADADSTW